MSVAIADENGPYAQIASNRGYSDLIAAADADPTLKTFFYHAILEGVGPIHNVADHLENLKAPADVAHTAQGLAALMRGRDLVLLTRGETADIPDENGVSKAEPSARQLFLTALQTERDAGKNEIRAHINAFKALRQAGYAHEDGVWKAEPSVSDVHVNRPMGAVKYGQGKRKSKGKDKDDAGTQDPSPYGQPKPLADKDKRDQEKDDPGTQDVSTPAKPLATPLPKYQQNQLKIAKRISGSSDIPLSKPGEKLAAQLGKRLHARGGLDVLGSSTLVRAKQTAQLLADQMPGVHMSEPSAALVPWKLGEYEGRQPDDVKGFIHAYIAHPDERPAGKGADGDKAETFSEAAKRQLKYFKKRHDDWSADPTMKMGDVVHSRGLELLQAYVDADAPDKIDDFLAGVDHDDLVHPDDPDHNALLVWKKNKIKELDPSGDDPLEGGYYLILHGLTDDDHDAGNADELAPVEKRLLRLMAPMDVCLAARSACAENSGGVDAITVNLAHEGLTVAEVRKVAAAPDNAYGASAKKWADKILAKIARNGGHAPWVGVELSYLLDFDSE
jgi:broad specificity phosphatase PhoE